MVAKSQPAAYQEIKTTTNKVTAVARLKGWTTYGLLKKCRPKIQSKKSWATPKNTTKDQRA